MSIRPTLQPLIQKLRVLLADPEGPDQQWSNAELAVFLDDGSRRANVNFFPLTPIGNYTATATVQTLVYQAPCGDWESGATLYDSGNAVLSPSEADYAQGRWVFTTDTPAPVSIAGRCFNLYGAAADALRAAAASVAGEFDYKDNNQAFSRSQKYRNFMAQAENYEARALRWPGKSMDSRPNEIGFGKLTATDVNPNSNPHRFIRTTRLTTYNVE